MASDPRRCVASTECSNVGQTETIYHTSGREGKERKDGLVLIVGSPLENVRFSHYRLNLLRHTASLDNAADGI